MNSDTIPCPGPDDMSPIETAKAALLLTIATHRAEAQRAHERGAVATKYHHATLSLRAARALACLGE